MCVGGWGCDRILIKNDKWDLLLREKGAFTDLPIIQVFFPEIIMKFRKNDPKFRFFLALNLVEISI